MGSIGIYHRVINNRSSYVQPNFNLPMHYNDFTSLTLHHLSWQSWNKWAAQWLWLIQCTWHTCAVVEDIRKCMLYVWTSDCSFIKIPDSSVEIMLWFLLFMCHGLDMAECFIIFIELDWFLFWWLFHLSICDQPSGPWSGWNHPLQHKSSRCGRTIRPSKIIGIGLALVSVRVGTGE